MWDIKAVVARADRGGENESCDFLQQTNLNTEYLIRHPLCTDFYMCPSNNATEAGKTRNFGDN